MNYLTHDGHELMTKNKLQAAVQAYLKSMDRQLLEGKFKLKLFKKSVIAKIKELNQEHSRCKSIEPYWWETDKNDFKLMGVGFSTYYIYHSKKTY
jgi:hypothetical protein|tara:strand:+ start:152 stop:436 length:285 start_codon:yes stop_codon:yes gene_type:complete